MGKVRYNVPLVSQGAGYTCWYASSQMMVRYYRDWIGMVPGIGSTMSAAYGKDIDKPKTNAAVKKLNRSLTSLSQVADLAKLMGMRASSGVQLSASNSIEKPTDENLEKLLAARGPAWYAGEVHGPVGPSNASAHAVVITGIDDGVVYFNDPWPIGVGEKNRTYNFDDFFDELRPIGFITW